MPSTPSSAHLHVPVQEGEEDKAEQVAQPVRHGRQAYTPHNLRYHARVGDHLQREGGATTACSADAAAMRADAPAGMPSIPLHPTP